VLRLQRDARPRVRPHWFHPRFLLVEGTKMSKSKGNFFTARESLRQGGRARRRIRLELIKTHYRANANFTMQGLADSQRQVERWRRFVESAAGDASHSQGSRDDAMLGFAQALNADLNIAAAIAEVNKFVARTEKPGTQDAELMKVFDGVLGVLELQRPVAASTDIGIFAPGVAPDPSVVAKLEERRAARAAKDFARSDKIRDELLAMGYAIKDVAGGKVEVRRTGV
jgi:cysteinyl-tRNA synthetase